MKNFWIVLLLVIGTLGFTACNAEEEPATEEPATEEVENEVEAPEVVDEVDVPGTIEVPGTVEEAVKEVTE